MRVQHRAGFGGLGQDGLFAAFGRRPMYFPCSVHTLLKMSTSPSQQALLCGTPARRRLSLIQLNKLRTRRRGSHI